MRRAPIAVAAVALALAATGSADAARAGHRLHDFTAIAKVTHASTRGRATAIFRERLKVHGRRAGHARLRCRFSHRATRCLGRWRLHGGSIRAKGKLRREGRPSVLRMRKGTGAYRGARGKVRIERATARRLRESFEFS